MPDTRMTSGNDLRLQKSRLKYDMGKFYFAITGLLTTGIACQSGSLQPI